mmetsp:Transcript_6075/g.17681  ORF Transcript_6075/g.17681 Transcript_6075/m.17681 type:complete len:268 (+) Transcript_6075:40-843(+)
MRTVQPLSGLPTHSTRPTANKNHWENRELRTAHLTNISFQSRTVQPPIGLHPQSDATYCREEGTSRAVEGSLAKCLLPIALKLVEEGLLRTLLDGHLPAVGAAPDSQSGLPPRWCLGDELQTALGPSLKARLPFHQRRRGAELDDDPRFRRPQLELRLHTKPSCALPFAEKLVGPLLHEDGCTSGILDFTSPNLGPDKRREELWPVSRAFGPNHREADIHCLSDGLEKGLSNNGLRRRGPCAVASGIGDAAQGCVTTRRRGPFCNGP